ncbi:hypothetical protein VTO42DRAFT_6545 [Malbranchea cinnamomea]
MAPSEDKEELQPLTRRNPDHYDEFPDPDTDIYHRTSIESSSTASVSLALLDRVEKGRNLSRLDTHNVKKGKSKYENEGHSPYQFQYGEEEDSERNVPPVAGGAQPASKRVKIVFWLLVLLCVGLWGIAFIVFVSSGKQKAADANHTNDVGSGTVTGNNVTDDIGVLPGPEQVGERITLDQVLNGSWRARKHEISWIAGPHGEDGLLLEQHDGSSTEYLQVKDIRGRRPSETQLATPSAREPIVLMRQSTFAVDGRLVFPVRLWPSPDLRTVLVMSDYEKRWRHSFTGKYWLFDVETQTGQPLDLENPEGRIQLASWSPTSDAVVFTRGNNMYLRKLSSKTVKTITNDGGVDVFYGIPDWVYEEEVFEGNSATWWSNDGRYVAFLRTNETEVPEFPVQYYLSRPSGHVPAKGEENYPDVVNIKYPKAGAPNPVVHMSFYDVEKGETFVVDVPDDFADDDRLVTEVIWAEKGKVLVRETNRESDILKMLLIDADARTGKIVRSEDIAGLDGGWVEMSHTTRFVPADPDKGRPDDGYVAISIKDGYNHLAYYAPVDNPNPVWLTSGAWEVVESTLAVDLNNSLVYFVGTKEAPTERHIYSVRLDGSNLQPLTDTSEPGYYAISFSSGVGYGLLDYQGPGIPWQKIINTPANNETYEELLEENRELGRMAKKHALPLLVYSNVTIDGYPLQVVERLPPTFDPNKKYPVLFHLYGGPGSQTVSRKFTVDFQSYVASSLEYIVVTVDGRGTGYTGRKTRCIVRDNLGHWEARDQIETARLWGKKSYVDASRMAIWGWSYGGYMTLKTLEQDGGQTFQYGMAVAPVTDWRLYDSIYTERYMHTPQHNPDGYAASAITNATALAGAIRFLVMHGTSDDNVHFQNSLSLLDMLDLAGVQNYDVHVFPDSDHGIYFHNAYKMIHNRLSDWLVNAFNGEWAKIRDPVPNPSRFRRALRAVARYLPM